MKLIPSIPQETDCVTSDFDNIVENAKDCGILFILLLIVTQAFRKKLLQAVSDLGVGLLALPSYIASLVRKLELDTSK